MTAQSQAQQYSMKALGVGAPTQVYYNFTTPKINNSGQVVGNRRSSGYVYSNGALTSLANGVFALDISNKGMIATFNQSLGDSFLSGPPFSSAVDVGRLTGCGPGDTPITAVNDSGDAVGVSNAPTTCRQPFLFTPNSQMTSLGGFSPAFQWLAINNSNQIVGYGVSNGATRAFELINGTLTDLDPSNATAYDSEAQAINDAGEFVVNSNEAFCTKRLGPPTFKTITYVCRGTIWNPLKFSGSTVTTLPALGPYGGTAAAIDYFGDVVGTSQTATGATHGFINLYGSTFDLNSHPLTNGTGWTILQAYDINDSGQIVALGQDASGNQDVVILTPQIVKQPPPVGLSASHPTLQSAAASSNASIGTVTLASPAPFGGTVVFLSSSNPFVKVPPMIRVAPKSTSATFMITTAAPVGSVDVTFFATTGVTTKAATLKITDGGF